MGNASIEAAAAADRGAVADSFIEYLATMHPFYLRPDELRTGVSPHACAVQRGLARQFIGATVSTEVVLCAQELAKQNFVTYIDVPTATGLRCE